MSWRPLNTAGLWAALSRIRDFTPRVRWTFRPCSSPPWIKRSLASRPSPLAPRLSPLALSPLALSLLAPYFSLRSSHLSQSPGAARIKRITEHKTPTFLYHEKPSSQPVIQPTRGQRTCRSTELQWCMGIKRKRLIWLNSDKKRLVIDFMCRLFLFKIKKVCSIHFMDEQKR